MDDYLEYLLTVGQYLPYFFITFVFLTLIPKSLRRINDFAKADYEANRSKWHRCYAPDICCHTMDGQQMPKQKPRKAVTRVYPKKQQQQAKQEAATAATAAAAEEPTNIYKRQVHTHTNVNKIAKMFENGGVQKKINRVTPNVLTRDFKRSSMGFDDEDNFFKNDDFFMNSHESPLKKENVVLRRLSKLSKELEENNENSANVLNQISTEEQDLLNSSWRSEPITIQRHKRQVPCNLTFNGNSATPSTISPAPSSPLSSPHSACSSPILRNAPILNMNTSLEDIFKAIAKSAENPESFLYGGCNSLSPVTSIDDILSQRRLSRPLSAYSISDLLNDEPNKGMDEAYVENFLKVLNKT